MVASVLGALLSFGSISILCSVVCPSTLAAVVTSYALVIGLNFFCFGLPVFSPLHIVSYCETQVDMEWKNWEKEVAENLQIYQTGPVLRMPRGLGSVSGASLPKIPKPNSTLTRLWALLPYAAVHGLIFLICTGTSIMIVREICLSAGYADEQHAPPVDRSAFQIRGQDFPAQELDDVPYYQARRAREVKEPALRWKEVEFGGFCLPTSSLGKTTILRLICAILALGSTCLCQFQHSPALQACSTVKFRRRSRLPDRYLDPLVHGCLDLGSRFPRGRFNDARKRARYITRLVDVAWGTQRNLECQMLRQHFPLRAKAWLHVTGWHLASRPGGGSVTPGGLCFARHSLRGLSDIRRRGRPLDIPGQQVDAMGQSHHGVAAHALLRAGAPWPGTSRKLIT